MVSRHAIIGALTLSCSLTLTTPTLAQDDAPTVSTTAESRRGATARTPARVETLHSDDLLRQGATDLASALSWLAGASPVRPTGTATSVIIDGLSASQLVVLRDGMPFARMSGSPDGPLTDLSAIPIDPAVIERIDVYRGSGPGGTGVAGGVVIDIITRRAEPGWEVFGRGLAGGQDVESPFRQEVTTGGHAQLNDTWSVQGLGRWSSLDALDVNGDGRLDTPGLDRLNGEVALGWRSERDQLRMAWMGTSQTTNSFGPLNSPLDDRVESSTQRLRVQGRWWSGHDFRLDHGTDLSIDQHDFSKVVRSSGFIRPKAQTRQLGGRQNLLGTWLLSEHDLQVELQGGGAQVNRDGETGSLEPVALGDVGAGFADTWYLSRSIELQSRLYGDIHNGFGAGWSAQVAGVWKTTSWLSARLAVSRTRRIPTPEERFLFFDHSEVGYRIQGNEDLRPEALRSLRAGLILKPLDSLAIEAEGFLHDIDDAIVTASVANDASTFTYANAEGARTAGANASLRWTGLPLGLMLTASHAWLPLAEDSAGQRLPLRAAHSTRLELRGRWLGGDLDVWGDLQARSSLAVPPNSPAAPGFAMIGLGASWQALDSLRFILDANNLLNQTNATWGPAPGFHLLLNVELRARSNPS